MSTPTDQSTECSQSSIGTENSKEDAQNVRKTESTDWKLHWQPEQISQAQKLGKNTHWDTLQILNHAVHIGLREFDIFGLEYAEFRQDFRKNDLENYKRFLIDTLGHNIKHGEIDIEKLEEAYEIIHGEEIKEKVRA